VYNPRSQQLLSDILLRSGKKEQLDDQFLMRLAANFNDIFNYFHTLYPYRNDLWEHLEHLVNVLIDNYLKRSDRLRKTDQKREADPHWFLSEKLVGMMLYTSLFSGDLKGLDEKLTYLEELGINLVHLMPLLKCPEKNNDGGYAVSDYRSINPVIGTMDDIASLAKDLHDKDMFLMMDLVLNHTSNEHEWAQKARSGETKYQQYYYCYDDRTVPDQFEQSLPQVFPETSPGNFTYIEEMNKWVMTVFHDYQWDLNYSNPEVFIEMLDIILFLANQGIDILRLDALAFMWKKIGTTSQNLDEAHMLVKTLKSCARVTAPGVLFLAEAIVAPNEIIKYFGQSETISNENDIAYNATLMTLLWDTVATKNNRLLTKALQSVPSKPYGTTWLNYVRCHDDIGLGYEDQQAEWAGYSPWPHRQFLINFLTGQIDWSFARGRKFMEDKTRGDARISGSLASLAGLERATIENDTNAIDLAIRRIIMLHSVIISYGGIPLLYSGDELGMLNDYSFEQVDGKAHDNRWMHRPKMDWEKAKKRAEKGTIEQRIFAGLQHLIALRKTITEFADLNNTYLVDCHNQHLLAYTRQRENSKVFVVCNLNDNETDLGMDMMFHMGFDMKRGVKDLVTGKLLDFSGYKYTFGPHEFLWISQNN